MDTRTWTPERRAARAAALAENAAERAADAARIDAAEAALKATRERMEDRPPLPRVTDHQPEQPARRAAAERAWSRHQHRTRARWSAYRRHASAATWTPPSAASRATGPR